ncbi:hypothetical protein [Streptomyces clavuligerus]|uniref:hypothetical protein n=1 Tax=Streptomyces clavuligerus TaxID=1901 RepID=UPI00017FFA09|nr:hypothetical protein [Streptomyces clavuligerus]EDY50453.1 hypothetical protein SSCG_03600 [Streptomyces clavuligerus]QCS09547.1 hypothetical protein CRV15_28210 [Streptomyces clavuligerus]QPJ98401.1 hypothetical protein GE265_36095 [Streptomyces clavuligerus]WDN56272.1 hypothetical protein LL058_30850 [Streptomyces clavuligerus]
MKNVARVGAAVVALVCSTALQAGTTAGATDLAPPPITTTVPDALEAPDTPGAACSQGRAPASGRLPQVDCARCQAFWGKIGCCYLINKRCCNYTPPPPAASRVTGKPESVAVPLWSEPPRLPLRS